MRSIRLRRRAEPATTGTLAAAALAAAVLAAVAHPTPARACGGCVAPPKVALAIDSHRMAIRVSDAETILWDQFRWSGDPDDFAWILPVPSVGVVELAEDGFFEALENGTSPLLRIPQYPGPPCCNCGNSTDAGVGGWADSGVTVYYKGTVGPYETATIGATDPNELYDWLTAHGYAIPSSALPTIEWYVSLGSLFVALRLAPEFGVDRMQPVRVRYPTATISFPLRMVAVGAGNELGLTLWIVSDRRYKPLNYPEALIDESTLWWDTATGTSNYLEVWGAAVAGDGGRTWVTEFAGPSPYLPFPYDPMTGTEPGRDDWNAATAGFAEPWLTRLRTRVAPGALDEDLFLEPSFTPFEPVDRVLDVTWDLNPPPAPPPCPKDGGVGAKDAGPSVSIVVAGGGGGCAVAARRAGAAPGLVALLPVLVLVRASLRASRRRRTR